MRDVENRRAVLISEVSARGAKKKRSANFETEERKSEFARMSAVGLFRAVVAPASMSGL